MPGAGTDKTKRWREGPGPVVILVEPQLGENIGAVARAMANFGLSRLRLVRAAAGLAERQGAHDGGRRRPHPRRRASSTTRSKAPSPTALSCWPRPRAPMTRPSRSSEPAEAAALMAPRVAAGETVAILFGRERNGLENDEVALADRIVTLPVNPAFASLNLAQAVVIVAYEWFKLGKRRDAAVRHAAKIARRRRRSSCSPSLLRSSANWKKSSSSARPTSARPCRSICATFSPAWQPTQQDIQTLHGVIMAIAEGRKGPARGGVLDGEEAEMLRALLAEHGRRPGAEGARPGARAGAAPAPQSDRGRARAVAGAGQRPPLRRPRL